MKIDLDKLIQEINNSKSAIVRIFLHQGDGVLQKPISYENLRISKNDEGAIALGDYNKGEGYIINDLHNISLEFDGEIEKHFRIEAPNGNLVVRLTLRYN